MPDFQGNMTPEEERMLLQVQQAQAMKAGQGRPQMSPAGMAAPTKPGMLTPEMMRQASQDISGKQKQVSDQRDYARELTQTPGAKGIKAGNMYVAPTWTGQLASALRQGAGAYGMQKAGKRQEELNKEQAAIDQAKGDVAEAQWATERGDKERGFGQTDAQLAETSRGNLESERIAGLAQATAQQKADQGANKGAVTTYHSPGDPATALSVVTTPQGVSMQIKPDGTIGGPIDTSGLTPWDPGQEGSMSAAEMKQQNERQNDPTKPSGGPSVNNMMRILDTDPEILEQATGVGPGRWTGQLGLGLPGQDKNVGPRVQSAQRQIQQNVVSSLVPDLKAAELKPVSNTDLELLQKQYAGVGTQPYGQVEFAANYYRPVFNEAFDEAIANGVKTEADKKEYLQALDKSTVKAAIEYGYPLEQLTIAGLDPDVLEWGRLMQKRKEAQ